jgi:hypothetical protein
MLLVPSPSDSCSWLPGLASNHCRKAYVSCIHDANMEGFWLGLSLHRRLVCKDVICLAQYPHSPHPATQPSGSRPRQTGLPCSAPPQMQHRRTVLQGSAGNKIACGHSRLANKPLSSRTKYALPTPDPPRCRIISGRLEEGIDAHTPAALAEAPLRALTNRAVGRLPAIPPLTLRGSQLASLSQSSPLSLRYGAYKTRIQVQ